MSSAEEQIIELWNQGLPVEAIAEGLDFDLSVVLMILHKMGHLSKVQPGTGGDEALNEAQKLFKKYESQIAQNLINTALYGANESARVKASIYAHEELRGRNEARVKTSQGNTLNLNQIYIHMNKASEAVGRSLSKLSQGSQKVVRKEQEVLELEVA